MVKQQAQLVVPHLVFGKHMDIIDNHRRSTDQGVLPLGVKTVHGGGVGGREPQDMPLFTTKHSLPGGMEQVRTTGLRLSQQEERIESASGAVNNMLATTRGFEILFGDEPLFEGP